MKYYIIFILLLVSSSALSQRHLIKGHVYDSDTKQALSGVNITTVSKSEGTTSDDNGYFEIRIEKLPAALYFSHLGYSINQIVVSKPSETKVEVFLSPEITQLEEVTVSAELIHKVELGDTLNVIDYDFYGNRIILVASPYRKQNDKRLYLTDLQGNQVGNFPIKNVGKQIKIPEQYTPEHIYLFKDFLGFIHILTQRNILQLEIADDSISTSFSTEYPEFLKYIFPIKAKLGNNLFYQTSNKEFNRTYRIGPDTWRPVLVKKIYDPYGIPKKKRDPERYQAIPGAPSYIKKMVSAPLIPINDEILIFDFFDHNIEVFDSVGQSQRIIPIDFHTIDRTYFWIIKNKELNQKVFQQKIIKDEASGKIYALFHKIGQRATLKEINPDTGEISREIEIPDLPNISKIKVHRNVIYFTYNVNTYPYYTNLYRMNI